MNYGHPNQPNMGLADRGSFMWLLTSITNAWLYVKLMDDVSGSIEALFGTSAAACFILAVVVFRQEQRDLLLNPMKHIQKEVHPEQMAKQGKGIWYGIIMWIVAMAFGTIFLP
jgi:hypothetical protein